MKAVFSLGFLFFSLLLFSQNQIDGNPLVIGLPYGSPNTFMGGPDLYTINAGDDLEGDFHIAPQFEPSGARCWVAHRQTNNVSVVDVENSVLIQTIGVGAGPVDIAFNSNYGLVVCLGQPRLHIIDLKDYSEYKVIDLFGQPLNVEVSRDGRRAMVALDDVDQAVVIDLEKLEIIWTIDYFPTGIGSFSFITSNTRNHFSPSSVALSSKGEWLATGMENGIYLCNVDQQSCDTLTFAPQVTHLGFSHDDQFLVGVDPGNPGTAYQIDMATQQLATTVQTSETLSAFNGKMALSSDGNRLLVPGQNKGLYIRFDQGDYTALTTNSAVFWTDLSADGGTAMAGGYNSYMVDMTSGALKGSTSGISLLIGALSPDGDYMLGLDPLRRERAETYYVTPTGIFSADPVSLGSPLEGDATYSVKFTHDGKKILAVNTLSGTISIVNALDKRLEKILPLEGYEIYHIAISPDDKWALVGERLDDQASLIDLDLLEVTRTIPTLGNRPDQTIFHPDGTKAYVLNAGGTDNISVIDLTNSPPRTVKNVISGNMGVSWINYGIRTNLAIDKSGKVGLLAAPFDDKVGLFDLENDVMMASFPVEGFPLHSVISEPIEGRVYGAVTLRNDGKVWIVEDLLQNPVVFGRLDVGGAPTQMAYNTTTGQFAVCSNEDRTVSLLDPLEFEVVGIQNFAAHLTPINVAFSPSGDQYTLLRSNDALQPSRLKINDQYIDLPSLPSQYMDINSDGSLIAIPGIHTDDIFIVEATATGLFDLHVVGHPPTLVTLPNPFIDHLTISEIPNEAMVFLYDQAGRVASRWKGPIGKDLSTLSSGTYTVQARMKDRVLGIGKVVKNSEFWR